ncbi:MAG: zf-HC2 domain-containing protein [Alphaproteobacteria bacterium]|nr:zf-HC2 domain-containing protein [Alphaproteobacteria bacterium]
MYDCSDVAVRLMDYAMDDLSSDARDLVDAHLAACPDCRQVVEEYRAVSDMVHDALDMALSPEDQAALDAAVLDAVARSA